MKIDTDKLRKIMEDADDEECERIERAHPGPAGDRAAIKRFTYLETRYYERLALIEAVEALAAELLDKEV